MSDNIALIRFSTGWARDGISEDGLPSYRPTIKITKSIPPNTEIHREVEPGEIEEFPGPYELFLKTEGARMIDVTERGFPLSMWPVITPPVFMMLTARDINTVEQLAAMPIRPEQPAEIREVAERARQMIGLMANLGKFEAQLREMTGQRDVLADQVKELSASLSAANALINTLKMKVA